MVINIFFFINLYSFSIGRLNGMGLGNPSHLTDVLKIVLGIEQEQHTSNCVSLGRTLLTRARFEPNSKQVRTTSVEVLKLKIENWLLDGLAGLLT